MNTFICQLNENDYGFDKHWLSILLFIEIITFWRTKMYCVYVVHLF